MKNSLPLGGVALAALLSAIVTPAYAAEDEAVILPEIVVEGEDFATPLSGLADPSFSPGTLTVPGVAQA